MRRINEKDSGEYRNERAKGVKEEGTMRSHYANGDLKGRVVKCRVIL